MKRILSFISLIMCIIAAILTIIGIVIKTDVGDIVFNIGIIVILLSYIVDIIGNFFVSKE